MQETQVQFLDWEDPLEKEMATHASILAWRIPWTEEPGRLQSMGLQELDTTEWLSTHSKQHIKQQRHYFANKGPYIQSYGFSSGHVWMWELDHKKDWALKNWCFWTVVLEKTLENPLGCKEIKSVNPKGNQSWIFIGRTDTEALILWPPDTKNCFIRKKPDAGKDWRQEEKGTTEDEMATWHHPLNGHESEQALGGAEGQPVCCSPWDCEMLDMTDWTTNVHI